MTTIIKLPLSVQIKLGLEGAGASNEYVPLAEYAALEAQIAALTTERDRLREVQFKAVKTLKRMVKGWRHRASGHYCQTYNPGMAQGLNGAADMLEEYVNEALREKR